MHILLIFNLYFLTYCSNTHCNQIFLDKINSKKIFMNNIFFKTF